MGNPRLALAHLRQPCPTVLFARHTMLLDLLPSVIDLALPERIDISIRIEIQR